MKNSIRLFFALLALAVLNSCTNSFDLVKRHYNKGFYASNSHRTTSEKKSLERSVTEQKKEETALTLNTPLQEKKQENAQSNKNENELISLLPADEANNKTAKKHDHNKATKEKEVSLNNENKTVLHESHNKPERDLPASGAISDTALLVLYIILAVIIPPLAVYIKQNAITKWFWITLILWIIGGGLFLGIGYFGAAWFAAFIIALLIILDVIT